MMTYLTNQKYDFPCSILVTDYRVPIQGYFGVGFAWGWLLFWGLFWGWNASGDSV
jgi:hypothetical protein